MSKEEDIDRLIRVLQTTIAQEYHKRAEAIIDAGFGYLGDAEAKQPAQPGELTRADIDRVKALINRMVEQSNDADTLDGANFTRNLVNVELDEIWSRILSGRAATEARVRAENEGRVTEVRKILEKQHGDEMEVRAREVTDALDDRNEAQQLVEISRTTIADLERKIEHLEITKEEVTASVETGLILELRDTIADLEKRMENAVGIDRSSDALNEAGWTFIKAFNDMLPGVMTGNLWNNCKQGIVYPVVKAYLDNRFSRPTPAKLTPEQMANAYEDWLLGEMGVGCTIEDARDCLFQRLLYGKSIEALYAEIKGGE